MIGNHALRTILVGNALLAEMKKAFYEKSNLMYSRKGALLYSY